MSSPPNPLSTASLYKASHTVMSGVCAPTSPAASCTSAVTLAQSRIAACGDQSSAIILATLSFEYADAMGPRVEHPAKGVDVEALRARARFIDSASPGRHGDEKQIRRKLLCAGRWPIAAPQYTAAFCNLLEQRRHAPRLVAVAGQHAHELALLGGHAAAAHVASRGSARRRAAPARPRYRLNATETELVLITVLPRSASVKSWSSTARYAASLKSMVKTTSDPRSTAAGESAMVALVHRKGSYLAAVRFHNGQREFLGEIEGHGRAHES
ncbi:hypothetical protein MY10362_004134 [Beauveria mimosiformis]